jgi:glycine/D-amino acid oxidase-like deaminating enzyme
VAPGFANGGVSFWWADIGRPAPRAALEGDLDCDVCIVGGGLTGLWTAYWLASHDPSLDIVVLDAEFAGFGASGRNGGWLSAEISGFTDPALVGAMERAVDEVIGVCDDEGIDADIVKGGVLHVARSPAQLVRMRETCIGDELDAAGTAARVRVEGALGAVYSPHAARVHPARLVSGIAAAVERRGVRILERTRVTRIDPGSATTSQGIARAPVVLRCLEGYTASIRGQRRGRRAVAAQPTRPAGGPAHRPLTRCSLDTQTGERRQMALRVRISRRPLNLLRLAPAKGVRS